MTSKLTEEILCFIETISFYFVFCTTYATIFSISILPFFYFLNISLEYIRSEVIHFIIDVVFFAIYKVLLVIFSSSILLWLIYYFFFCVNFIAKSISNYAYNMIVKYVIRA